MSRGKETKFLTELKQSFNEQGCFAIKIGDTPMASGLRFTTQKEFDMVVCIKCMYVAIEAKFLGSFSAFGKNKMRDHQIEYLDKVVDAGGEAFVFLNVRFKGEKDKGIKRTNKCFIFQWDALKEYWQDYGTIKKKDLELMMGIDGAKQRYDLSEFIKNFEVWNEPSRTD